MERYREFVRERRTDYLQRKHRISLKDSNQRIYRFVQESLELFSRIGSVYESPDGITVCSMSGKK